MLFRSNAQANAIQDAANNAGGAAIGFMGMNMAQNAGGINTQSLYQMAAQQPAASTAPEASGWTCPACGAEVTGKFCPECGAKKPEAMPAGWTCPACGTVSQGKFCPECGARRPAVKKVRCDKCGWEPADPANPPKFCPECGDPINEADLAD